MRWVVFLRGVNVGKANRCQPAVIASQLSRLGVINIGAVGTFVVREDVSESALRAAIAKKLPFKCEIMICPARDIIKLASKDPFAGQPSGPDITRFVSVLAKRTSSSTSVSTQSPVSRRLATQDHRDPRKIRSRSVSSPDESDRLPRQDREAARCARHYSQLEYDSKGRADSFSRLTKDHTEHTVKRRIEVLRAKQYNRHETHQFRYAAHTSC